MGRKSRTVYRASLRFLLIVGFLSMQGACQTPPEAPSTPAAVSPAAAKPVAPPQAVQLADGTWTVQGKAIHGARRCGD
jgi:hypothetical protein